MSLRNLFYQGLLAAVAAGHVATAFADATTRPSSSQTPYLEAVAPGVRTFSILTVGDSVNFKPDGITPYRMVGIPDGLGTFDNGDGTFTLLMNHELNGAVGVPRTHGFAGAFISKWTIDKRTLTVLHGEDLMKNVQTSTGGVYYANGGPMSRFCAATSLCSLMSVFKL